jgi:hypothetical protein
VFQARFFFPDEAVTREGPFCHLRNLNTMEESTALQKAFKRE